MAITKGAKKAIRSQANKRLVNDRRRRQVKRVMKDMERKLAAKDIKGAEELLPTAYKALDKAAKRGVIKKNTSSRKKSRLVATIKRAAAKTK